LSLITIDQLDMAVPQARYEDLIRYIDFLNEGMEKFEISSGNRISAFIAQLAHESADFRHTEENLNYSGQALRSTWPRKFTSDALAQQYHRNPEKIASFVYADRFGNRGEASGDGWRYRGRGLIQLTFHDNYEKYAQGISDPSIMTRPDQVAQPRHAAMSACWFWKANGLNALADAGTEAAFNEISYKINGGWKGKEDRLENWAEARAVVLA
jgi:putative chitinase